MTPEHAIEIDAALSKVALANERLAAAVKLYADTLMASQVDPEPEDKALLDEHLWELYE